MTIAFWCVLIAGILPYVAVGIAKAGKRFDNNTPRDWLAKQDGYRKRAHAAHLNTFEAFPFFAAGVIIAHLSAVPVNTINAIAIAFVALRMAYIWCYVIDRATLRSLVWIAGLGLTVTLFVLAGLR